MALTMQDLGIFDKWRGDIRAGLAFLAPTNIAQ
jgi:hypothetical protein